MLFAIDGIVHSGQRHKIFPQMAQKLVCIYSKVISEKAHGSLNERRLASGTYLLRLEVHFKDD